MGLMTSRALAVVVVGGALSLAGAGAAVADEHDTPVEQVKKVWVCKYVGQPGVDERLKEGKQPIEVSVNAVDAPEVGAWFSDAQGRSYVVALVVEGQPEPDEADCPGGPTPTMTTTTTVTTTATTTMTATATSTATMTTTKPATGPVVETDRPARGDSAGLGLFAGAAALLAAATALALNRRRQAADH